MAGARFRSRVQKAWSEPATGIPEAGAKLGQSSLSGANGGVMPV